MFKLMFQLALCSAICYFALLYWRERYRNFCASTREWLRQQRIMAAARVVGPAAVAIPRHIEPVRTEPHISHTEPPVKTAVTVVPTVSATDNASSFDYSSFDVPTYLRKFGRLKEKDVKEHDGIESNNTATQVVGNEELINY